MKINKKQILIIIAFLLAILGTLCAIYYPDSKMNDVIGSVQDEIMDQIQTYEMSEQDIKNLPSTEIINQTIENEQVQEQEVEDESFELQGNIAYEGDRANTWNIELGDYKGLTYYSQVDSRWRYKMYSSIGDSSQTIGTSGCGPTSASMIVTAIKGAITPDKMADLFVKYGYRSSNSGTYWSAFRAIADEFNIEYQETSNLDTVVNLLKNNNYVVASCGNGLFTTGGHFIVLVGVEGNNIKIYDPYLYSGKFETSTRRGKVTVSGNTVYCPIENFRKYANYKGFFAYKYDGQATENNSKPVTTESYTRYVNVNTALNVRSGPGTNYSIVGKKYRGDVLTIFVNQGNWSKIDTNKWVCSDYLSNTPISKQTNTTTITNTLGTYYRLKTYAYIYSKSNLSGIKYNYLPKTQVKVLSNISSTVDYVQVVKTGRKGYINKSAYTTSKSTTSKNTVGQYKRLKNRTILYSKSNLSGTKYNYLPLTQVKILKHISNKVDYVRVVKTGRYAYVNVNAYK